ncbi:hypothetical protein Tco_1122460 [Tanacetum coccineum]|uniref:Uncharacterized protein n=1 Tax=Tanacetum coccineum TaxID=301880 RepID=A0ABQ5J0N5_9ASTR
MDSVSRVRSRESDTRGVGNMIRTIHSINAVLVTRKKGRSKIKGAYGFSKMNVLDCLGKNWNDDVEKDIEDCSNNVTEKCGVVNNNMSNNVEGEILEDHFDGDRGNDTIEDNADVNTID